MIEFQYIDGCPNSGETLENLKALVKAGKVKESDIKIVKADDLETAKRVNFQGSPTILVNGIDIYTEKKAEEFSFNCRMFLIDDVLTGVLTQEYIIKKIEKLNNL